MRKAIIKWNLVDALYQTENGGMGQLERWVIVPEWEVHYAQDGVVIMCLQDIIFSFSSKTVSTDIKGGEICTVVFNSCVCSQNRTTTIALRIGGCRLVADLLHCKWMN